MATNDLAVLIPSNVHILTAAVGTAKLTLTALETFAADLDTPPASWNDLGHTSVENVTTFDQEGGETTVLGSIQNRALREVQNEVPIDYFTANSLQVKDNEILTLYYGGGDATVVNEFALPDNAAIQERAIHAVFIDGAEVYALYANRCAIRREAGMETPADNFAELPLRFTPLKATGQPKAIWIADELGALA